MTINYTPASVGSVVFLLAALATTIVALIGGLNTAGLRSTPWLSSTITLSNIDSGVLQGLNVSVAGFDGPGSETLKSYVWFSLWNYCIDSPMANETVCNKLDQVSNAMSSSQMAASSSPSSGKSVLPSTIPMDNTTADTINTVDSVLTLVDPNNTVIPAHKPLDARRLNPISTDAGLSSNNETLSDSQRGVLKALPYLYIVAIILICISLVTILAHLGTAGVRWGLLLLSTILYAVAFALSVSFIAIGKHQLQQQMSPSNASTDPNSLIALHFAGDAKVGPALWLSVAGIACLLAACVLGLVDVVLGRKARREERIAEKRAMY